MASDIPEKLSNALFYDLLSSEEWAGLVFKQPELCSQIPWPRMKCQDIKLIVSKYPELMSVVFKDSKGVCTKVWELIPKEDIRELGKGSGKLAAMCRTYQTIITDNERKSNENRRIGQRAV